MFRRNKQTNRLTINPQGTSNLRDMQMIQTHQMQTGTGVFGIGLMYHGSPTIPEQGQRGSMKLLSPFGKRMK